MTANPYTLDTLLEKIRLPITDLERTFLDAIWEGFKEIASSTVTILENNAETIHIGFFSGTSKKTSFHWKKRETIYGHSVAYSDGPTLTSSD